MECMVNFSYNSERYNLVLDKLVRIVRDYEQGKIKDIVFCDNVDDYFQSIFAIDCCKESINEISSVEGYMDDKESLSDIRSLQDEIDKFGNIVGYKSGCVAYIPVTDDNVFRILKKYCDITDDDIHELEHGGNIMDYSSEMNCKDLAYINKLKGMKESAIKRVLVSSYDPNEGEWEDAEDWIDLDGLSKDLGIYDYIPAERRFICFGYKTKESINRVCDNVRKFITKCINGEYPGCGVCYDRESYFKNKLEMTCKIDKLGKLENELRATGEYNDEHELCTYNEEYRAMSSEVYSAVKYIGFIEDGIMYMDDMNCTMGVYGMLYMYCGLSYIDRENMLACIRKTDVHNIPNINVVYAVMDENGYDNDEFAHVLKNWYKEYSMTTDESTGKISSVETVDKFSMFKMY